jgi:hypothetical protein
VKGTNRCAYVSTGIHLYANQVSDTNGFSCKNHPNAVMITRKARNIFNEIEAYVLSDVCVSLSDVHNWDKQDKVGTQSFVSFMRKTLARNDPSMATLEHHNGLIRRLEDSVPSKHFPTSHTKIYAFLTPSYARQSNPRRH